MVGRQRTPKFWLLWPKELHGHEFAIGQLKVRTKVTGYVKKHEITGQVLGERTCPCRKKCWKPWVCGSYRHRS